ncbi:MAG TPA: YceI family protein [Steroidobacteraceae bacterium]|nr:YceI family protein [Steroidobacteraceae bacterium]
MSVSDYKGGGDVARLCGLLSALVLVGILAGCATPQAHPPAPAQAPARRMVPSPLLGSRFDVIPAESRLTILVYRAGALAMLGHDHVVSCRCLSGAVYLPGDPLRAGFDLRVSVKGFTVDDPAARAAEHSKDFPPDVPQGAQEATRHNMLSAALLNAAAYPDITLRAEGLRPASDGKRGHVAAQVLVGVAGRSRSIAVPIHYDIRADEIVVTGEFPLKQTDLGLTPFSAAGGALKVADAMTVRLSLVARRAHPG